MAVYPPVSLVCFDGLRYLIRFCFFFFDFYSNTVKAEDGDRDITWSDAEPDAPSDGDGDVEIVPQDTSLKHDSQEVLSGAEAVYVDDRYSLIPSHLYSGSSAGFEEEDPTIQVMLKSIQDPELAPIYDGLPDLGYVLYLFSCHISDAELICSLFTSVYRSVRQYTYVNTVGMGVVTLQNVQSQVGTENISYVAFVILFAVFCMLMLLILLV